MFLISIYLLSVSLYVCMYFCISLIASGMKHMLFIQYFCYRGGQFDPQGQLLEKSSYRTTLMA